MAHKSRATRDISGNRDEYSPGYDSVLTQKYHASRTAEKQARWFIPYLQPGMKLLDCGCGSGSITVGLAEIIAPGEAVGIDIAASEIERAEERVAGAELTNIHFEVGDVYQLNFPDDSFDVLFSHNVLEHLGEPHRALREMMRVLKPNGAIGIRDSDWGGILLAPDDRLLQRYLSLYEAYWTSTGGNPRLGRQLKGLLTETGLIDVDTAASYDVYSTPEELSFVAQIAAARVVESDFVEQVIARSLASVEELEAIRSAWLAWPEHPGAFLALAAGEAVGRKP